jgi:hypothetical protein
MPEPSAEFSLMGTKEEPSLYLSRAARTGFAGAGAQYVAYWTPQEVLQADAQRRAKQGGP